MALAATTRLLKALGDETRLRILNLLRQEELSGTDLIEILNVGQSRVSTHLTMLKEVGLVVDRRVGRRSFYKVVDGPERALFQSVMERHREAPEFAADESGLIDLRRKRKEESKSYFDRVAATFGLSLIHI